MINKNTKKVKSIEVTNKKISELLEAMSMTGFQGKKLSQIVDIWEHMINDKDVTIIMGYSGSLSTTGQWKIINWLIENHFIDILVPTGANISEDIVEAMGNSYIQENNKIGDKELLKQDLNRYYDVYGKESDYLEMIELISEFILTLKTEYNYNTREFLFEFGKWLNKKNIDSIVATAAKNNVPIYCPAIVDSPYGDATLICKNKNFNIIIDQVKDFSEFMGLAEKIKEVGVIYIGGGVPKDFIQLLAVSSPLQYNKKDIPNRKGNKHSTTDESYYPHKYAIQISTDSPQWGGLSGCTFDEAISWGKILSSGEFAQCYCDATIALPIVTHALNERVKKRNPRVNFNELFKNNNF